jgi:hypothetical protein
MLSLLSKDAHDGANADSKLPSDAADAGTLGSHTANARGLPRVRLFQAPAAKLSALLTRSRQSSLDTLLDHRTLELRAFYDVVVVVGDGDKLTADLVVWMLK